MITPINRFCLVTSLFSQQLFSDPNGLFNKVSERLRGIWFPIVLPSIPSPSPMGEKLLKRGELSASIRHFKAAGLRGRWRALQIERQLLELETPIAASSPLQKSDAPKRILFYFTNSLPNTRSGYTERSQKILKALDVLGLKVKGVTRLAYPVLIGKFVQRTKDTVDGIEYNYLLPSIYPSSWEKRHASAVRMLVAEAKAFEADVIHTTTDYKNAIVASHAARELGIPWVYETRGELHKTWLSKVAANDRNLASKSEFFRKAALKEEEAMRSAARVFSLSEVSRSQYSLRGILEQKIDVLPNAVSIKDIGIHFNQAEIRNELDVPSGFLVGTITSVVGYEGLDDLIRCIAILEDVSCLIVGDGEALPGLKNLAKDLGIAHRVIFAGKKPADEIWKWYASLDVFVVPRKDLEVTQSVTPIKPLRAQALGIPVVASNLAALREVTGNVAFYVTPENPEDLAFAISKIRGMGKDDLQFVRSRGMDWVAQRTWEANASILRTAYKEL